MSGKNQLPTPTQADKQPAITLEAKQVKVKAHTRKGKPVKGYTRTVSVMDYFKDQSFGWQQEFKKQMRDPLEQFYSNQTRMAQDRSLRNPLRSGHKTKGPVVVNPKQAYAIARSMQFRWAQRQANAKGVMLKAGVDADLLMGYVEKVMLGALTMDQAVESLHQDTVRMGAK
jgi:hypothetical protein